MKKLLLTLAIILILPALVHAAVIDIYNGESIYSKMFTATAGDVLYVHTGVYHEPFIYLPAGVNLIGDGASSVEIVFAGSGGVALVTTGDNRLEGLTITVTGNYSYTIYHYNEGSFFEIVSCVFNGGNIGIYGFLAAQTTVTRCRFNDIGTAIKNEYFPIQNLLIQDNIFSVDDFPVTVSSCYITNLVMTNNTIVSPSTAADVATAIITNFDFINNIVYGSLEVPFAGSATTLTAGHNCWFANHYEPSVGDPATDISVNPLFYNVDNADYRLQNVSECLIKGDPSRPYLTPSGLSVNLIGAGFHMTDAELTYSVTPVPDPVLNPTAAAALEAEIKTVIGSLKTQFQKFTLGIGFDRLQRLVDRYEAGTITGDTFIKGVDQVQRWYGRLRDRLIADQSRRRPIIPGAIAQPMIVAANDIIDIIDGFMDKYYL